LEGAEQVTPILCSSPLASIAKAGIAPGVVLLGDAAGFLDPITGGGMSQALMTAELLAEYIQKDLLAADEWLPNFHRDRRALLWDYNALTAMVLWLSDHPAAAELLLRGLRIFPALLSHLICVSGGTRQLFSPRQSAFLGNTSSGPTSTFPAN
jgi:flavin-dependent dehydrogenase